MNNLHALRRFWWIVLFGVAMASLTGFLLIYHVDRAWPLKVSKRAKPTFVASTELLVDSPNGPYLRTIVTKQPTEVLRTVKPAKGTTTTTTTTTTPPPPATPVTDTKSLIDAANLFPLLIQSDAVYAIRKKLVGDIPGAVSAKALYSLQGATRFRPSVVPVMQITSAAPKPKFALALAQGTARAFNIWLARQQQRAKIPAAQRIIVRELHVPQGATATGGPSYGLPALASLAILALFVGLSILLGQRLPAVRIAAAPRRVQVVTGSVADRGGLAVSAGGPEQPPA
jgi:hypothetical protein